MLARMWEQKEPFCTVGGNGKQNGGLSKSYNPMIPLLGIGHMPK
jgi:hypothetical protein